MNTLIYKASPIYAGGGYYSERRNGTGISSVPPRLPKGGLRCKLMTGGVLP